MSPMMLSRVADHLYWMSRQMERAENLARLVRV
ncbi:MAG: putative alpha-helical domain with a conserved motif, partial [Verrucomicrobiota bacterium]